MAIYTIMSEINVWWPRTPKPGNFGDILTPLFLKEFFDYKSIYVAPPFNVPTLMGVGSIIGRANENCTVWGSGLMTRHAKLNPDARYLSVRGPLTYERLKELNIKAPAIFGDPALLLPKLLPLPKIHKQPYEYGIFAHYVDTEQVKPWYNTYANVRIINPLNANPYLVAKEVMKCKRIISSSLHGIIVSHAYGIPAVWVKHSDKLNGDGVKFEDHYESVGLKAKCFDFQEKIEVEDFSKFEYQVGQQIDTDKILNALARYLETLK